MRECSAELKAFLATATQFLSVDLYTITLSSGSVLRYSAGEGGLTLGSDTYSRTGLRFKRGSIAVSLGLQVASFDMTVFADPDDSDAEIESVPFAAFVRAGGLDGAYIRLEELIMPTWGDVSLGKVTLFYGRVSGTNPGRTSTDIEVRSLTELLNKKMPRTMYQPGCIHTLYDQGCTMDPADFTVNGIISAGSGTTSLNTALSQATGYFDLGYITFMSGVNNGVKRGVRAQVAGVLALSFPLTQAPSAGDTFTVVPGCDKRRETCTTKFNNILNFGGTPYVPVVETAH